jgi:hypothetical protein
MFRQTWRRVWWASLMVWLLAIGVLGWWLAYLVIYGNLWIGGGALNG